MKIVLGFIGICLALCAGSYAQSRSFSADYVGYNTHWNGTNWVSTGTGYGSVVGPSTGTGDINFYSTGNAASAGLARTLTQAAAITASGTVSSTAVQAYTGSFGNVNATGTISATNMNVGALNVTNLTVNGGAYSAGGGGTSATMVAGWPDAIICVAGSGKELFYATYMPWGGDGKYYYESAASSTANEIAIIYTTAGAYSTNLNASAYDCTANGWSITQLYTQNRAFNFLGNGGANGTDGADNITSGTTKITANSTGYISLTTGGTTTGYFTTTGGLVVPNVSTTGTISATNAYLGQLGVGRPIESWMASNTVVAKGMIIADSGFFTSSGQGLSWDDAHVSINSNDGTDLEFRTNYTGRMKIDANGNVGIGSVTSSPNPGIYLAANGVLQVGNTAGASGFNFVGFFRSGNLIGNISQNGTTAVAYNTTSDRRLKENIHDSQEGLALVERMRVRSFNFKNDPSKTQVQGFIAQELYQVYPEAVTVGGADASRKPWQVEYGRLTPVLVKALQDLKVQNDALKSENAALRSEFSSFRRDFDAYKKVHP